VTLKIFVYFFGRAFRGQSPADADLNLLDIARKIELYGIIMHPAKDHEGVQLNLAVAHMGILVFQNFTKINTFSWAKIRKLSFKRKKFLVKLHPENYGFYKDTVEFYFDNRDDSKNFWKKCIEHHSFFRCISTQRMPRQKSKLLTRGSSFRYYGRTQKELIETAREHFSKNRSFDRSYHSMRSISQFGNPNASSGGGMVTGTQSLNRNLASRSTGALLLNGGSSNLSSADSNSHFHVNYNQNQSSSAHHLSYHMPASGNKAATLQSQPSADKMMPGMAVSTGSLDFMGVGAPMTSEPSGSMQKHYANQQAVQYQPYTSSVTGGYARDADSSTHGSRTIDSRFSRAAAGHEKSAVSEDDEDDDEEEEEEDEEEANGVEYNNHLNHHHQQHQHHHHLQPQVDDKEEITGDEDAASAAGTHCTCGLQHLNETADAQQQQQAWVINYKCHLINHSKLSY
jgi:hypothetical protein